LEDGQGHPSVMASASELPTRQIVVVGGSLVGLSMAIALARRGASVTVLEQTPQAGYEGGGGLGVDVGLLTRVTGLDGSPPVCQGVDRATTAWPLLAAWLENNARAATGVTVQRGAEVTEVGDGWARTSDGRRFDADVVIGADGARSTVRRWVSPDRPDAVYAGFVLWRAMVPEAELPAGIPWLRPDEPSREYYSGPYRLVTYPVPGADGSSKPGDRRLNLVWYDPARSELLASRGLLDGDTVHGSLGANDVPEPLRRELDVVAGQRWPTPWREALDVALRRSLVFATPVVHYWPERLVRDRSVLVGDAAHAASPMVGGGFRQGLYDVDALATGLERNRGASMADLLSGFERERLLPARTHVENSQAASAHYLERRDRM
jgi:2-polyprenyl-6-methoxyphenol hydroxylase-like FAD-dependent oxidoreductase